MKTKFLYIIISIALLNCSKTKKENNTNFYQKNNLSEIKKKIVEKGDEKSFTELILKIGNSNSQYDILPYAMIMANKYKSGEGCHQVFLGVLATNNPQDHGYNLSLVKNFNTIDKDLAISYLQKGTKLNNENCILALEELYRNGWGVEKDSIKAIALRRQFESVSK